MAFLRLTPRATRRLARTRKPERLPPFGKDVPPQPSWFGWVAGLGGEAFGEELPRSTCADRAARSMERAPAPFVQDRGLLLSPMDCPEPFAFVHPCP